MRALGKDDIHFQNDFEDQLVEKPWMIDSYSNNPAEKYETLFQMGMYALKGYKIFDYILLNTSFTNDVENFELDLMENGIHEEYIDSVLSRDDEFLKAYMIVFFELENLDDVYGSKKNVADIFIKDTKYSTNYKMNGLMGLCEYKCDKNTIDYIKENIVNILNNSKDLEGCSDEEKQHIINNYLDSIDQYQKEAVFSYIY